MPARSGLVTYRNAVTIPGSGGKRKMLSGKGKTDAAARRDFRRVRDQFLAQHSAGQRSDSPTLRAYAETWLTDRVALRARPQTVRMHRNAVARVLPALGDVRLAALTPALVQHALSELVRTGAKPGTVNLTRASLRTLCTDAARDRYLTDNPVRATTAARDHRRPTQPFTPEQAARLLAAGEAEGHPDWPVWALMLCYGFRLGEAIGVRWQDVNEAAGTITVSGQVTLTDSYRPAWVAETKTETSAARRTLPLVPVVARALAWQRQQTAGVAHDHGLIVAGTRGQPLQNSVVRKRLYRALERYGLPRRVPHAGRHGAVTTMIKSGIDIKTAAAVVGHSTTALTASIYTHVDPEMVAAGVRRLAEAIAGADLGAQERERERESG